MKYQLIINKTAKENITATVCKPSELTDKIEYLVMNYNGTDKITGYTEEDIKPLPFSEIECIFVEGGKTYAVLTDGSRYLIKLRLYEIEKLLPAAFIKINKSALGNTAQIERFTNSLIGAVDVVFKCGHTEYVSRRCFSEIKRRILK